MGDQQTQQQFQLQLPQQPFQLPIPEQQYLQPSPLAITPEQQQQQQQQPSSIPVIDPFQNQSSVLSPYYQQFLQQQEQLQPQITPQSSPLFPFNSYNNRSFSSNLSTSTPSPFPSALPSPTPSVQPLQLEQPVLLLSNNTSNFQNQSKIDSGVEQPLPISNSTNTSQNQSIIDSSVQPDNQTATAVAEGELQPLSATERMSLLSSLEAGDEIPNHYIVVLKDTQLGASANISIQTPSQAAADAKSKGAEVRHVYENALKGFAIRVPNDQVLAAIRSNPNVAYIEPDRKVQSQAEFLPFGIDRADGDLSSAKSGDGTGTVNVDIAIIDTGIDLDHPDLNVPPNQNFNYIGGTSGEDDNGHGTHVAGIAAAKDDGNGLVGMAPGASLWALKVLDSAGNGFVSDATEAIDEVTARSEQIDVANMSLGGVFSDAAFDTAISNSVAAGITYVVVCWKFCNRCCNIFTCKPS